MDRILKPEPIPEPVAQPPVAKPDTNGVKRKPGSSSTTPNSSKPAAASMQQNGNMGAAKPSDTPREDQQMHEGATKPSATSPPSVGTAASADSYESGAGQPDKEGNEGPSKDEIYQMMKQMFPDVDDQYLSQRLGPNPTLDDVRGLAEEMAAGNYVKNQATGAEAPDHDHSISKGSKKGKSGLRKSLGRAFGNLRGHGSSKGGHEPSQVKSSGDTQAGPATGTQNGSGPVAPEHDASNHSNMCDMLQRAAGTSAPVNKKGVQSSDTLLTEIPKELNRTTCEVIPGQNLKPHGRTHNGIQVFSAREHPNSEVFLQTNQAATECFSLVLNRLGGVFDLSMNSIAIFHDPTGGTIAFNANKSLHFNARFFFSLHYLQEKYESYDCYAYWFITFCHELAHNLVSGHNKEHGFYTENYASLYLPKFLEMISTLPK